MYSWWDKSKCICNLIHISQHRSSHAFTTQSTANHAKNSDIDDVMIPRHRQPANHRWPPNGAANFALVSSSVVTQQKQYADNMQKCMTSIRRRNVMTSRVTCQTPVNSIIYKHTFVAARVNENNRSLRYEPSQYTYRVCQYTCKIRV